MPKKAATEPEDLDAKKLRSKRHSDLVIAKQREDSRAVAECGPIPPVVDPERRESCRLNLQLFVETYLQSMFVDPITQIHKRWASFHIASFQRIQSKILTGGKAAMALPRGSAKTTIALGAAIWAACYGHCKFAAIVCSTDPKAKDLLEDFKLQFEVQETLAEDFPEICVPVRHIERKSQKCNSQLCNGVSTRFKWNTEECVFPTIEGSQSSGFRFQTSGLTGSGIRGLSGGNAKGNRVRPDVVLLDDPQTDESAKSLEQCRDREKLIQVCLGMAGPGAKFTACACVTVIREGDTADSLLKRWNGIRSGILDKFPDQEQLKWWQKYNEIRIDADNRELGYEPTKAFYRENRHKMIGDIKATWEDRYNPESEIDAEHCAVNIYFDVPELFHSDYMNQPKSASESETYRLDPLAVRNRITGLPRGVVPMGHEFITVGVDIQKSILFFAVMSWKMDLTGSIIDYGCLPSQGRRDFDLTNLSRTLQSESGAIESDIDAAVSWGLVELGKYLSSQKWIDERGFEVFAKNGQIDINFRESESAVSRFCRQSRDWKSVFTPAMGRAATKTAARISEWKDHFDQNWPKPIERRECEWMESSRKAHGCRERQFDTNFWKTYVNNALALPLHSSGSISLFGENPEEHVWISQHLTSHYSEVKDIRKSDSDPPKYQTVWMLRNGVKRDDLLDCVVGCAVSASVHGARLTRNNTAIPLVKTPGRRVFSIPGRKA